MTANSLSSYKCKDLAQMAKKRGVRGWHAMRKDQLVQALVKAARSKSAGSKNGRASSKTTRRATGSPATGRRKSPARRVTEVPRNAKPSRVARRLQKAKHAQERSKNLAQKTGPGSDYTKDRLVAMVRDPYWLHAYWELTWQGVERAQAAMGQQWHTAIPVLRLMEVADNGTTCTTEMLVRDIKIHGGVNNWYVEADDPPKSYRIDIGYLSPETGKFFVICRSNAVSTPKPGASDALDENWTDVAENFEQIYAMSGGYSSHSTSGDLQELFEERLRRPMSSPVVGSFGRGAEGLVARKRDFFFEVDAELIVYGRTEDNAQVTLQGKPVQLRPDGTFTVRFSMPNCRQVLPAVARSVDGVEERTIVLAIERNTKSMEPLIRDPNE